MTRSRLHLWMQTLVCILLAALLCASAVSIFREGSARRAEDPQESIYTREIVAEKLTPVAPLFLASVGLLIAGAVLGVKDDHAGRPVRDPEPGRNLVVPRAKAPSGDMEKERRRQKKLRLIGWGVFALCMVPIAVYLIDPSHFPEQDPEGMFRALLQVCIPWTASGIGALAVTSVMGEKQIRTGGHTTEAPHLKTVQVMMAGLAVILIIAGILNLSARDVLYKAITICSECIGLG